MATTGRADLVTPPFSLSQTDRHVEVAVKVGTAPCTYRCVVDGGCIFGLACERFYLPLVFPGGETSLVNGQASFEGDGSQEASHGCAISFARDETQSTLVVRLQKQQPGVHLADLASLKPSIFAPTESGDADADEEERLMGLEILQNGITVAREKEAGMTESVQAEPARPRATEEVASNSGHQSKLPCRPMIGNSMRSRIHEASSENAASDEDEEARSTRLERAAQAAEDVKWDEGMYLDNFVDEDGEIEHLVLVPLTKFLSTAGRGKRSLPPPVCRTDISEEQVHTFHLLLLDLLLAQAYDLRTTLGDPTVESSWTVCKLCRSLCASCFPRHDCTVQGVVAYSIRRQLSFPLYRNWRLCLQVGRDVVELLAWRDKETTPLAKINERLDSLAELMDRSSSEDDALPVYVRDVVHPLQACCTTIFSDESLQAMADQLDAALRSLTKSHVSQEWDMDALEEAAKEAIAQGEGAYV